MIFQVTIDQFTPSPLIRCLESFMSEKIDLLANEHVEKSKDKIQKKQKERIQVFQKLEEILKKKISLSISMD